jgi:hypothetical protein
MEEQGTDTTTEQVGELTEEQKVQAAEAAATAAAAKIAGEELTPEQKAAADAKAAADEKARKEQEAKDHKAKSESRIAHKIALAKAEAAKSRDAQHKAELEAAELRGRLAAQQERGSGQQANLPPARPKMEDFQTVGDFNAALLDYTEKLTDFKVSKIEEASKKEIEGIRKFAPVAETPEQKRQREIGDAISVIQEKVASEYGEEVSETLFPGPGIEPEWKCTETMRDAIIDNENATKILAHFAENPEVSAKISKLPYFKQAVEIDKLGQILAAKKQTQAAAPLTKVDGKAGGGTVDPSKMTDREFYAWRRQKKLNSA